MSIVQTNKINPSSQSKTLVEKKIFALFADLFEFPSSGTLKSAQELRHSLESLESLTQKENPRKETFESLKFFLEWLEKSSKEEIEEKFIETFELKMVSYPYLGFHLFGESFKRGEFLSKLIEKYAENNFDYKKYLFKDLDTGELNEGILGDGVQLKELPDHIKIILRFLSELDSPEEEEILVSYCLIPGLKGMLADFGTAKRPKLETIFQEGKDILRQISPEQMRDRALNNDVVFDNNTCGSGACGDCSSVSSSTTENFEYEKEEPYHTATEEDKKNPYLKLLTSLFMVLTKGKENQGACSDV